MKLVIRYHEDIFGSFANDIDSNEHVSSDDAHIFFLLIFRRRIELMKKFEIISFACEDCIFIIIKVEVI